MMNSVKIVDSGDHKEFVEFFRNSDDGRVAIYGVDDYGGYRVVGITASGALVDAALKSYVEHMRRLQNGCTKESLSPTERLVIRLPDENHDEWTLTLEVGAYNMEPDVSWIFQHPREHRVWIVHRHEHMTDLLHFVWGRS